MSTNIYDLYQALILDHNKYPKNFRKMHDATYTIEGYNPLCGDHYNIFIKLDDTKSKIEDLSFDGQGCAISKASASLMTSALKGKSVEEARELFQEFHDLLNKKLDPETDNHHLGKLKAFSGIWKYPARVKCASLAWHSLKNGLDGNGQVVKTE